ncbi:MAG: AAA family ATPase [Prevotella sp.]|nr:AAA family ATPase [Prevotella sp.]
MEIEDLYVNSQRQVKAVNCHFKRYLYSRINWEVRMLCIRGAKGVGKTTLMKQYIKENFPSGSHQALYVSLDDLWFSDHKLIDLAEYHYTHGGTHLFIDEVHRYPGRSWSQELKNIYDRYPDFRVVFSGSSMLQLDTSSSDLSRRCIFYEMQGLSFREYLQLEGIASIAPLSLEQLLTDHSSLSVSITAETKVLPAFSAYLRQGYYPFYRETGRSYAKAVQQVISNIIDFDLPAVERMEYITTIKVKRLFVLMSQMVPFTLNLTSIGREIEAPRQTVLRMFNLLHQSALVYMIYNEKNNLSQLSKPEKIYLENPNLLFSLSSNADIGNVRETFFANQLKESHEIAYSGMGDFLIDRQYTFEAGGRNKTFQQIKDMPNSYLAVDDLDIGTGNRIPLWMFGLLY